MGNGYSLLLCTVISAKKSAAAWAILIGRVISVKEQHQTTILKTFLLVVLNRYGMNKKFSTPPPKVYIHINCCQSEKLILKVILEITGKALHHDPIFSSLFTPKID